MHIKPGFMMRSICGEPVVLATGVENLDFNNMISLSESASFIWKNFANKDFDVDILTQFILDNYEVDEATARKDCQEFCNTLIREGIAE